MEMTIVRTEHHFPDNCDQIIVKADELLKTHSMKAAKKRKREEQIQSQAQEILASGKDPAAMTKGDLDILLKEKGIKAGADKATSYDLYLNSL